MIAYAPLCENKNVCFSDKSISLENITRKYEKVLFQETQKYILFNQKENANNCLSDLCNNFSLSSQKKDANNHLFDLCDTFSLSSLMSEITGAKPPK